MRSTSRLGIAGLVIALAAAPAAAQAAWLAAGTGDGSAQATSVDRANAPVATRADGTVSLTWEASGLASGSPVAGYDVIRHVAGGADTTVCSYVTTTSCTDAHPVPGKVSYGVVPRIGLQWTGPESPTTDFQYDVYAPTTTMTRTPTGNDDTWVNQDVTVTLTATDPGPVASGVASIHYALNNEPEQTIPGNIATVTVSQEQVNQLTFWAVDQLGNSEANHGTAQVRIDKTAPVSTGSLSGSTVTLSAQDNASGLASILYRIDSGAWTTYSTRFTLDPGKTATFHAIDNAGNVEPDHALTNDADTDGPTVVIVAPSGGAYNNRSGKAPDRWSQVCATAIPGGGGVCGTASDNTAVASVVIKLQRSFDSKCWTGETSGPIWTTSACSTPLTVSGKESWYRAIPYNVITNASLTLSARGVDTLGNVGAWTTVSFSAE